MSIINDLIREFNTADPDIQRDAQDLLRSFGLGDAADFGAEFEALGPGGKPLIG